MRLRIDGSCNKLIKRLLPGDCSIACDLNLPDIEKQGEDLHVDVLSNLENTSKMNAYQKELYDQSFRQ